MKADFGMTRDVVAHGQQLGVHQLLRPRDNLIARRVWACELGDERIQIERALERVQLVHDVASRFAFGWGFLRDDSGRQK